MAEHIMDLMKPEIRRIEGGESELHFDLTGRKELTIPTGVVQGGIVAVMLDMAMAMAAEGGITTASLQYEILRPVMPAALEVRGRIVRQGRRITFAEAVIENAEGEIVAKGTQTGISMT